MQFKLELVNVPVSDVDRAKAFYENIFGAADIDVTPTAGLRFIQFTPVGSACSISIGEGLSDRMRPGSIEGLQLVVTDIEQARDYLIAKGLDIGPVDVQDWGKFVYFSDPDGNGWAVQQLILEAK